MTAKRRRNKATPASRTGEVAKTRGVNDAASFDRIKGLFVRMPLVLFRSGAWASLTWYAKALAPPLFSRIPEGGSFSVGDRLLASEAGIASRYVGKAIKELSDAGLIVVLQREQRRRSEYFRPPMSETEQAASREATDCSP